MSCCGDIAALSAAQTNATHSAIGYQLAAVSLDAMRQVGESMVALLEDSLQLGKELGKGDRFDAVA